MRSHNSVYNLVSYWGTYLRKTQVFLPDFRQIQGAWLLQGIVQFYGQGQSQCHAKFEGQNGKMTN